MANFLSVLLFYIVNTQMKKMIILYLKAFIFLKTLDKNVLLLYSYCAF